MDNMEYSSILCCTTRGEVHEMKEKWERDNTHFRREFDLHFVLLHDFVSFFVCLFVCLFLFFELSFFCVAMFAVGEGLLAAFLTDHCFRLLLYAAMSVGANQRRGNAPSDHTKSSS
mmetsp:Transcript_60003/g.69491  ORF Transcript_60003/g.69491 Transcript_60003/m.69491 type:complete len:116 (-) Transcript_60003:2051-2398(-)